MERAARKIALGVWVALVLAFLYIPIGIICLYAFNSSNVQSWPIAGLTTKWFSPAIHNPDMQQALWLSLKAAALATAIALVLGSAASFGVHRFRFFGRERISFLLVLPIALPGIITGMALNSYFTFWKFNFGLWTIVIGHATFCVVVVYNNVIARLRRVPGSLTEASMDLGADGMQTFRYVTFPTISTALISGGAARLRALVRRGDRDDVHRRAPRTRCRSGSSARSASASSSPRSTSSSSSSSP